jgi:hypothetical protein
MGEGVSASDSFNKKYLVQLYNLEADRINANAIKESNRGSTESRKTLKKLHK